MRRVYYVSLLVCFVLTAASSMLVRTAGAQSQNRRGEPNALSTGYYVVDSDDNAPTPWRPQYFFQDTTYNRTEWVQVWTGPQQFGAPGQYFFDPTHINAPALMDTVNECMAGPIYMRLGHSWNFYGANYDSVYISSNGFIGFRPYAEAIAGTPPMYCRGNTVDLKNSLSSAPHAIVAALWADLDMRHGGPHDTSIVYFRTSTSLDTFFVNYYNFRLKPGGYNLAPQQGWTAPGADRLFCKKFQIVLANTDSSIQVNYGGFTGSINGFPPTLAYAMFEGNATIGLVNESGSQGTSVLYGKRGASARWDAVNPTCRTCNKEWSQTKQWALKFKRWHNIVRALAVDYPPRNYEICLGSSVTPKAKFMNVDAVTQTFKVRFAIRNVVTGIAVYSRVVSLLGMLPGSSRDTSFSPYATNPNILSQLGTFNACAIATTYDTADRNIGDRWPFDDTVCTNVFGVRRTSTPYRDPSNNYSKTVSADIPDQTLWISIGAQVVDGESNTWDPPPPRDPAGFGPDGFVSPVILMDRADINGNTYSGSNVGDTLVSFPINLQGKTKANLSFDFQRAGQFSGYYKFEWDADLMYGPEHTVLNSNTLAVMRPGDSMILEFKDPLQPGCNPSPSAWNYVTGIDGGHDFEFKKFFMTLNTGVVNVDGLGLMNLHLKNYFTADFRFRLRLKAKYDAAFIPPPNDDLDPWYIDNPTVLVPLKPEIEVMWVRVVNPYTKIPASQAVSLPVYVKVANMSSSVQIAFPIRVQILDPNGNTIYWQSITVNSLAAGTDSIIQMPNWNAQDATAGGYAQYQVHAWLDQPGYDSYEDDNGTYTLFYLGVETGAGAIQEFAYDDAGLTPGPNSGNDWPSITQLSGVGVGFNANSNGSFAMKFKLATKDTLYGVRVYFANANQAADDIRLSVLEGDPSTCTPGDTVLQEGVQVTMHAQRGGGYFNQFWSYYFPKPIILPGGTDGGASRGIYWLSVSQLGLTSMMMGANVSRGGALIREWDPYYISPHLEPAYDDIYGTQFSNSSNDGDVSCAWAIEANAGSGAWAAWTPSVGWWPTNSPSGIPYSEILAWQTPGGLPSYMFFSGSYTPMIRPMVSQSVLLPVELVYLKGEQQNGSAVLTWATSNERDNQGFYVQRKPANSDEIPTKLGFVSAGEKNSSTEKGYGYIDRNVAPGTYDYSLLQVDVNGSQHVSNTVQLSIDAPKDYTLSQNVPNPFTPVMGSTELVYTLANAEPVSLVIYNQLGEVVKTLANGDAGAGPHTVRWDGKDESGNEAASGSYICKLIAGEHTATIKMTVSK